MTNIEQLEELHVLIKKYEQYQQTKNEVEQKYNTILKKRNSRLVEFDNANKDSFIKSHIGEKPIKPKMVFLDLQQKKKKEYDIKCKEYELKYNQLIQYYYDKHKTIREKLDQTDKLDIENLHRKLYSELNLLDRDYCRVIDSLEECKLVPKYLRTSENIKKMITYLKTQRATTINTAIIVLENEIKKEEEHLWFENKFQGICDLVAKQNEQIANLEYQLRQIESELNDVKNTIDSISYSVEEVKSKQNGY